MTQIQGTDNWHMFAQPFKTAWMTNDIPPHDAYEVLNAKQTGKWLITCDHASNAVPDWINGGDLGLPQADMNRHIAFDIGAAAVTRHLSKHLDAPAILSRFSRLVIDPNRGEDDPTLLMQLYDGTIIPANRRLSKSDHTRRLEACYRPYHMALGNLADRNPQAIYVAIHSFTPRLHGRPPRPWDIGILYAKQDPRFAQVLLARLRQEPDICVGENEPYKGDLKGDAVDQHALRSGRLNALVEIRHDLIDTAKGQKHWAKRLAVILEDARKNAHF